MPDRVDDDDGGGGGDDCNYDVILCELTVML